MQSIQLNNMLEKARGRAAAQAKLVSETRSEHETAVKMGMISTAKKLRIQLKRQEDSLNQSNEEVREIEHALVQEGDLISPKKK